MSTTLPTQNQLESILNFSPFIKDCFEELLTNSDSAKRFKEVYQSDCFISSNAGYIKFNGKSISRLPLSEIIIIMFGLLSRTPDDKPVLNILQKQLQEHTSELIIYRQLDNLLLSNFVRVCFGKGKGFQEALEAIDKIYKDNLTKN